LDVKILAVNEHEPLGKLGSLQQSTFLILRQQASLSFFFQAPLKIAAVVVTIRPVIRVDKRKRKESIVRQIIFELTNQLKHLTRFRVGEDRESNYQIEFLAQRRKRQVRNAGRVERKGVTIIKNPMRPWIRPPADLERLVYDIDAPVTIFIDRRER